MSEKAISHYQITGKLGAGGMGVVYLAHDPRLERSVAVKVLSEEFSQDDTYRKRFLVEARSASALNHPNIVTVYEIGMDEGRDFIAMEHVEGQALRSLISDGSTISVGRLLDIGIQLAAGLAAAHQAGVVHRDLKPGNVIVRPDGAAKILDFGLARRQVSPAAAPGSVEAGCAPTIEVSLTRPGVIIGTPGYMAPEQARGETEDHRSDIFSLGCILYAMATGETPFRGETIIDVLHDIMHQEPPPIDSVRPDLPAEIKTVIAKCMEKRPEDRFADAAEIERALGDIRAALTSGSLGAPGLQTGLAGGPRRRWPLLVAGVAATLLIVALGYLAFKPSSSVATTTVSVVDEEGKEIRREIPTREHRSKVAVLPFVPDFADTNRFWLTYAASNLLLMDLFQDYYVTIDQMAEYEFCQEALKLGFPGGRGAPLSLKRRIARAAGCSHFITGRVGESEPGIWTEVELYLTDSGRLVSSYRREGANLMAVIDESSVWLRRELGVPDEHLEAWLDMSIADLSTTSPAALEAYAQALVAIYERNDIVGMRRQLEVAVTEDASFAWGLWSLYISYVFAGEGENPRIAEVLDNLMTHLYRLPERLQFAVKSNYFQFTGDPDKQLAVLKMWAELYPDDNLAHEVLVQVYFVRGQVKEAFAAQARLLELEPANADYITQAATMHRSQGDLETARQYLESLVAMAPEDPQPLASLGELLQVQGEHEEARRVLERAMLMQPRNLQYRLALAGAEFQLGNIAKAVELEQEALDDPLSPAERMDAWSSLAGTYERTGRLGRAVEILNEALREGEGQVSPLTLLSSRGRLATLYARRGDREGVDRVIKDLRGRLTYPLTVLTAVFSLRAYAELGDIPATREATVEVLAAVEELKWEHLRPTWLRGMGEVNEAESNFDTALEYYDRWLALEPTETEAMFRRGRCLRKLGDLEQARGALAGALRQQPYLARYLVAAARIEHELGSRAAAISHLERAVAVWVDADSDFGPAVEARRTLAVWRQDI